MPRTGRGGKREGTPGASYPNRSDLRQPISTVPNQTYGEAAQQQAAQRSVPMAPTQPEGVQATPAATPPPPGLQQQAQQPPQPVTPGSLAWTGPTQRPNEPVTAGLPTGAGPGPEAMTGVGAAGFGHANTAALLASLAQMPGATKDVADLAAYASQAKA